MIAYSLSPVRNSVREIVISLNSIGRMPLELSIVRATSARPSAARLAVPAKMTSSIFWLRTADGACAPSTQAMASTTFDLPEPLGPTTTVTPGSRSIVVASANDLKPLSVSDLRNTAPVTLIDHPPGRIDPRLPRSPPEQGLPEAFGGPAGSFRDLAPTEPAHDVAGGGEHGVPLTVPLELVAVEPVGRPPIALEDHRCLVEVEVDLVAEDDGVEAGGREAVAPQEVGDGR